MQIFILMCVSGAIFASFWYTISQKVSKQVQEKSRNFKFQLEIIIKVYYETIGTLSKDR